jgi:predicted permease
MVVGFTVVVSLFTSVVFGLTPALQATRPAAADALRGGGARGGALRAGVRARRLLVASQIALAFVLLASAGVLARSLSNTLTSDAGFTTRDAVIAWVEIPAAFSPGEAHNYGDRLLGAVASLPGVRNAALTLVLPFGGGARRGFDVEGYQRRPGEGRELNINVVSPDYFRTLGIPLLAGRPFDRRDTQESEAVAIVNRPLADRYFGGAALGRTLRDSRGTTVRIVGVAGAGPAREVHEAPVPTVYYALSQERRPRLALIARTSGDASPLVEAVRRRALTVDTQVPVFRVMTLNALLDEALTTDRLAAALVAAAAAMTLLLAVIGVYGVIAYSVATRSREIGVRVALGATSREVIRLVVAEGLSVTTGGLVAGAFAAVFATKGLQSMLAGVNTVDLATFVVVPVVLTATALAATVVPAWRALSLDPGLVLRAE